MISQTCPNCRRDVSPQTSFCRHCGAGLTSTDAGALGPTSPQAVRPVPSWASPPHLPSSAGSIPKPPAAPRAPRRENKNGRLTYQDPIMVGGFYHCPKCNAVLGTGTRLCVQCKAQFMFPVPAARPSDVAYSLSAAHCTGCGSAINTQAQFCDQCGLSLSTPAAPSPEPPQAASSPAAPPQAVPPHQPAPSRPAPVSAIPPLSPKKRGGWLWWAAGAAIFFIMLVSRSAHPSHDNVQATPEQQQQLLASMRGGSPPPAGSRQENQLNDIAWAAQGGSASDYDMAFHELTSRGLTDEQAKAFLHQLAEIAGPEPDGTRAARGSRSRAPSR